MMLTGAFFQFFVNSSVVNHSISRSCYYCDKTFLGIVAEGRFSKVYTSKGLYKGPYPLGNSETAN